MTSFFCEILGLRRGDVEILNRMRRFSALASVGSSLTYVSGRLRSRNVRSKLPSNAAHHPIRSNTSTYFYVMYKTQGTKDNVTNKVLRSALYFDMCADKDKKSV